MNDEQRLALMTILEDTSCRYIDVTEAFGLIEDIISDVRAYAIQGVE